MEEKMIILPEGKITCLKGYFIKKNQIIIANLKIDTDNILIAANDPEVISEVFKIRKNESVKVKGLQVIPEERDCIFFWVKEIINHA